MKISVAGSTTVQPLAELLAAAYMREHPEVKINVMGGGSSVGITSVASGVVDIGTSSRQLVGNENKMRLVAHIIARDAIAIIVHPTQTVGDLTLEQVRDIFSGKINNWSAVGGSNRPIHVVSREEGSGTRAVFEEVVFGDPGLGFHLVDKAILQPTNGAVRTTVAGDPDAIGYISLGYADSSVKIISINNCIPSSASAIDGTYPIVRPMLLLTRGEPRGAVKQFIDFCLSPAGQEIVGREYIRVDQ